MRPIKYCATCALRAQDGAHCGLTGFSIEPKKDFCSKHNTAPHRCDICGRFIVGESIIDTSSEIHEVCPDCLKKFGTCSTCAHANVCDFETNPINLPQAVIQEIRRGNMVSRARVMNPERIKETCAKNCCCWNGKECLRNYKNCGNYNHQY